MRESIRYHRSQHKVFNKVSWKIRSLQDNVRESLVCSWNSCSNLISNIVNWTKQHIILLEVSVRVGWTIYSIRKGSARLCTSNRRRFERVRVASEYVSSEAHHCKSGSKHAAIGFDKLKSKTMNLMNYVTACSENDGACRSIDSGLCYGILYPNSCDIQLMVEGIPTWQEQ